MLFIADGAEVLWSLQQEFFPDADVCLDWFHVVEKLWKAGKAICRGTRRERQHLEAWVAEQKRSLRHGKHAEVAAVIEAALEATPVTGPGNKYRREVLAEVAAHLRKNAARLEYSRLRRQDLDISSGIIEGRYVTSSVSGSTAPACGGVAIAPRPSSSSAASSSMASGVTSSNSSVPVGCVSRLNLYRPGRMTPCSRKPRSDHETIGCTVGSAPFTLSARPTSRRSEPTCGTSPYRRSTTSRLLFGPFCSAPQRTASSTGCRTCRACGTR
ncbi:MAG: transposase [Polyangiaceae bacterium]|nr:transposase [Polyangiaceae bacterium]